MDLHYNLVSKELYVQGLHVEFLGNEIIVEIHA
jgi:hypothetical protein